eukprot:5441486-Pyramimonas_sp.AAC.1
MGQHSRERRGIHAKLETAWALHHAGAGCSNHPQVPALMCSASRSTRLCRSLLPTSSCCSWVGEAHGTPQKYSAVLSGGGPPSSHLAGHQDSQGGPPPVAQTRRALMWPAHSSIVA